MARILEYVVTEPPESALVRKRVIDAMQDARGRGIVSLVLRGETEVPRPTEQPIEFPIAHAIFSEDGSMRISGPTEDGGSVIVTTDKDPELPATASLVVTD